MRKVFPAILALLLLAGCTAQQRDGGSETDYSVDGSTVQSTSEETSTLEDLLANEDFDLARALLLFSERYYPEFSGGQHDTDIPAKLIRFEKYTDELRAELRRDNSPRQRIRTLVDFVHIKLGLRFDRGDRQGENPNNLFFDRVLQTRYGYCVSLSLAYLVFGQAAGLDVSGIRIPGHFAVLYRDEENNGVPYEIVLESTDFGDTRDQLEYWTEHRFSATSVEQGVYLTPLTDKQVFGTLYNNLAGITFLRGDADMAAKRYTRALELAPNNAEALYNRAIVNRSRKLPQQALKDLNEALRLDPNFVLAYIARAGLLWENGERDNARKDLGEAMRKRPDWPEPYMMDGMFLAEQQLIDEAREAFHRALEADPDYRSAHLALAELERATGNESKAQEHERKAGIRE